MNNIIQASAEFPINTQAISEEIIGQAKQNLKTSGWALMRGFEHDLEKFSDLVGRFCSKLTFDPAREFSGDTSQKVDAGIGAIGLHIENGNTPFPPDVVAFYSRKSAKVGSQTTLCDGADIYNGLSEILKKRFSRPIIVSRTLPENLWKQYIANEHPQLTKAEEVTELHLQELMNMLPGQSGDINDKGELYYRLCFSPVLKSSGHAAFANAILGPSFNYEKPKYHFEDGTELSEELVTELRDLAEKFTMELSWQDGDMILIDNTRVMHGRRAIEGDPKERQLVIAMGSH